MAGTKDNYEEQQRRLLQEYIFNLEDAKDKAEELAVAHALLRQSQDFLMAILSCTIHGLCLVKTRRVVWCNKAFSDILGWSLEELAGKTTEVFYRNADEFIRVKDEVYQDIRRFNLKTFEYDLIHQDGYPVPCLVIGRALDESELSKGLVFSVTDITEVRQSQEALQMTCDELEKRSAALMEANTQLYREIEERKAIEQKLNEYRDHLEDLVKERTAALTEVNEQLRREMDRRQKIEEELLKAQKLESLGILAGGIAHDFNNILTAIMGNVSLLKFSRSKEEVFERLEGMEKACFRARDLTRQLLTFAKGGLPVKKTVSITELIKDSTTFALRGSNVQPNFALAEDLWPVEVDEGQISQVLNNLIINADQAMPEGGLVRVAAENVRIGAASALPLESGRYIKVSISDQGGGISKDRLPKIFDPYFTTKSEGNGLGLTTAFSIVKKHDGHITVESELGKGATFQIYLPASEEEITEPKGSDAPYVMGRGRILVMDDEEVLRKLIDKMLRRLGYDVALARDGREAMEIYRKSQTEGPPIDLVIMDLTIPGGMGGKEVIKRMLEIDHKVKAIASSGYSNDPLMANFKEYGFAGVISKPFRIEELGKILHQVLKF